jgi:ornithine cyclodeaminase
MDSGLLILQLPEIRRALVYSDVIHSMRAALIAQSRGECDTPMPMHLDITPEQAEVHMKSSYRRGGRYFALKVASTFPGNLARGLSTGNGMVLLSSAETGEPLAILADAGHLTDVRTAAVAAMVTRELGRRDDTIGILGTGIQARLQVHLHAEVLSLKRVWIWGRSAERAAECARELSAAFPRIEFRTAASPTEVGENSRLIITATSSRRPLIAASALQPATHICAVGSDSPGKQELDPAILQRAALLLVDSRRQCEKLGELQHALSEWQRAVEIGAFCETPPAWDAAGISVCDLTGLGVEDLYIAESCFERLK